MAIFLFYCQQERDGRTKHVIPIKDFLNGVTSDELYGFVQCDVTVPNHLKPFYSQFPPIFQEY